YRFGAVYPFKTHQCIGRNHLTPVVLYINFIERGCVIAVTHVGLCDNAVKFSETVKVRNKSASVIHLQCLQQIIHAYTQLLCFFSVHFNFILWVIGGKSGEGKSNFLTLHKGGNKLFCCIIQRFKRTIATILQHKFKAIYITKAGYCWKS